jgi:hypothetical protein
MRRRIFTGLLLCGASVSAHAGESCAHKSKITSSAIQNSQNVPNAISSDICDPSVVFTHTKSSDVVASLFDETSHTSSVAGHNEIILKEVAPNEKAEHLGNLRSVLDALRFKRVEYNGDDFKVTFRQGSAQMATKNLTIDLQPGYASVQSGNIKVALQSDLTSMSWNKTF